MKKRIEYWDLVAAFDRWDKVYPKNTVETLEHFLQTTFPPEYSIREDCWFVDEEVARRIQLLLGPHYQTIIKMIAARNET